MPKKLLSHSPALREALCDRKSQSVNFKGESFVSMDQVTRILSRDRVTKWARSYPFSASVNMSSSTLIDTILGTSRLLFAALVIQRLEYLFDRLSSHGLNDDSLFDGSFKTRCDAARLTTDEFSSLKDGRKTLGAILQSDRHLELSEECTLPYLNINHPNEDRIGGFGVVRQVQIAKGHLRNCTEVPALQL